MIPNLIRCIYWRWSYKSQWLEAVSAKAQLEWQLILLADYIFALHDENQALKRRKRMEIVR